MFHELIPELGTQCGVIAPDLPGFGNTAAPPREDFAYAFDKLADIIGGFAEALQLDRYAHDIFYYGSPIGLRLAMAHPERVTAIISRNGNAYIEELNPEMIRTGQYLHGADASFVSPDGYTLDNAYMARPGADEIQLDLILDSAGNIALYPAFHAYFRAHQPPLLAIWGRNDPHFSPAGALAYRRDLPDAEVILLDTGHFALETHAAETGAAIRRFLATTLGARQA